MAASSERATEQERSKDEDSSALAVCRSTPPLPVVIRWMIHGDMPWVANLDWEVSREPWYPSDFERERKIDYQSQFAVAVRGHQIVGYLVYRATEERVRIRRLAVARDQQRQGIGAQMIAWLSTRLIQSRRDLRVLVDERDIAAQLFFQTLGFQLTNALRRRGAEYDTYLMVYHRPTAPADQADQAT